MCIFALFVWLFVCLCVFFGCLICWLYDRFVVYGFLPCLFVCCFFEFACSCELARLFGCLFVDG